MTTDLILIANGSEARLLLRTDAQLVVLDAMLRTEARLPPEPQRLQDRHGGQTAAGTGERCAGKPPLDPLRRRLRPFAGLVARRFEQVMSERHFDRAVLFAACPFLSELMRQLSPPVKKRLQAVVDADISELELPEAARRIEQELDAAAPAADDSSVTNQDRLPGTAMDAAAA